MFNVFKRAKPSKKLSRSEFARTFNFEGKDFARACVYRACHMQDENVAELTQMIGKIKELEEEKSVDDLCASSIVTLSVYIASEAAKKNGLKSFFPPFDEVPKHIVPLVAFACLVTLSLHALLDGDGVKTDLNNLSARSASNFFPMWEKEKMVPHALAGQNLLKKICASDEEGVKEWRSNLHNMTNFFVLQWDSENEEIKKIDFLDLFGKLFKSLTNVIS